MNKKTVAVVGLGYVGLPVALIAKEKGWNVIGLDVDTEKVEKINARKAPFEDEHVERTIKQYPIEATTEPARISGADVIVVAVPTPVNSDHEPDLSPVISALEAIRPHLRPGQLISIESTINPGVMDEIVVETVEQQEGVTTDAHGYSDEVVLLVHCPERVNPGDPKWSVRNIPRVIGGYTTEGTQAGAQFYESILESKVRKMDSVTEAEAVKIFENTFRDINIAFVNEMAKSFDKLGIDVKNVIEGAATKPFAFMAHYPGSGVGGHCISVDPYYMIERGKSVGFDHEFLKLARQINDSMPEYTVQVLNDTLHQAGISKDTKKTVALLGLAYKKNIDDTRESPALDIKKLLEQREDIELRVFDPHVPSGSTVDSLDSALQNADAVLLATNHDEFMQQLTPETLATYNISVVIDGKNALDANTIAEHGIWYHGIGRSSTPR